MSREEDDMSGAPCDSTPPAAAIRRWAQRPILAPGSTVLDVAAGGGRHTRLFAELGHAVTAVDRDVTRLVGLESTGVEVMQADLEGAPWPFPGREFDVVVVTNYLWRPLLPTLIASVAPGGHLLYETFAVGHERYGRPRNPDFLLRPRELLTAIRGELQGLEYGHGAHGVPITAIRQRLLARRPPR